MRKAVLIVLGVVAVLVLAVVLAPLLIDWNRFKPEIAAAVRDATGRELRIEGDIDVALLPAITVRAEAVHLANPAGFRAPDLASIRSVEGRVALWPLLRRRVVVERFVIDGADLALEVNDAGAANWVLAPKARGGKPEEAGAGRGLPISDLRLDNVRLTNGAFSYRHALSGQDLIGRDLDVSVALPALAGPLTVDGHWTLNDEPVTLQASVDPLQAVLRGSSGRIKLSLDTRQITVHLDSGVQAEPLLGLDGEASIEVPSVGALAAWLDVPLATNPGPLKLHARFKSDGASVALEEATLEGDQLSARASARVDVGDAATEIVAKVESGVLDIDRYLPPPSEQPAPATMQRGDGSPGGLLEVVPDAPLDLGALRRLIVDVDVAIEGIKLAGYAVGPIRFTAKAKDGVLVGDLDEVGLYDGTIGGSLRLDASDDTLAARSNLVVANLDVGALASVAGGDTPAVTGRAGGRLRLSTEGKTARELTANAVGELDASLQQVGGQGAVGRLSAFSLSFDRPTLDARPHLAGRAVYDGEPLTFDVVTEPLDKVLAREPVAVDAKIDSDLLSAAYGGRVLQRPVFSLDGTFDAKVTSVAHLLKRLGRSLPAGQKDPGVLEAHAVLKSDGRTGKIEQAYLRGEGLSVKATGGFDARAEVTRFDLGLTGGVLRLDRYLPAAGTPAGGAAGDHRPSAGKAKGDALLAALPDEPLDMAPLRAYAGEVDVALEGLEARGVEFGAIALNAKLEGGVLDLVTDRLEVAGGNLAADLKVDGAGDSLAIKAGLHGDKLETPRLDAALEGTGVALRGLAAFDLALTSRGKSLRRLATGATGNLKLDLPGLTLADGPIASVSGIDAAIELPGVDANPKVTAKASLEERGTGTTLPIDLDGELGPLPKLLGGEEVPLQLAAHLGATDLEVKGRVAGLDTRPRPDLQIRLTGERLSDLDVFSEAELPEIGPLSLAATLTAKDDLYQIADLAVQLGHSDLAGKVAIGLESGRPQVTADLESKLIDVDQLMPPEEGQTVSEEPAPAKQPARLIPDEPLPLDALKALDAELTLTIAKLRTHLGADVEDVLAKATLTNGRLQLAPLKGATAGGELDLDLTLDGAERPATLDLDLHAKDVLMGTLVSLLERSGEKEGKLSSDIKLSGAGDTPHAIAASLRGRANLIGEGGAVDSTVLKLLAAGIGNIFDPIFGSQGNTDLNCFVASFDFKDGVGTSRALLVDFPSLSVVGAGTVNLKKEKLKLHFATKSKTQSLAALAVPFDVGGSLAAPKVTPDVTGTAIEAVKAAGIYVNPLVAVGVLAAREVVGMVGENPCVAAVKQAAGRRSEGLPSPSDAGVKGAIKDLGKGLKGLFGGGN